MSTTTAPNPRTPSSPQPGPTIEEKAFQLEKRRFRLEKIGLTAVIVTLLATAVGLYGAKASVDAASRQLYESRYESVYAMQLDLWQLAAEHPELAPYVVGGKKPGEVVERGTQAPQTQAARAAQDAAVTNALDFYAYVFAQYAPTDDKGNLLENALEPRERPDWVPLDDWISWQTWAATIVTGFEGAPGMCDQLNDLHAREITKGTNYAYDDSFTEAVRAAVPNCITN